MCGIVGYLGEKNIKEILLNGLKELEYRGYDSAGIAVLENNNFSIFKAVGKLVNLEEKTKDFNTNSFSVGIGHIRWATHGKPTELNAHPHIGESSYVVHNGIIENYAELKKKLVDDGVEFLSQTDTEVIVHQFEKNLKEQKDAFKAFKKTISQIEGAYAILLITKGENETIFFAKNGSPMLVGVDQDSNNKYFASSDTPLIGYATEVNYFEDGDFGYVNRDEIAISDIVVLPSHREGVPRTLLEACSMSKPIVATDVVGCRETVENGKNGFLVPVKSPEILAEKIHEIALNPELSEKMGKHSRYLAETIFDIKNITKQYLELY
jgi:glucosamine--fructose-6-phosphate aminotransferase (isomerizing)